jgi:radical SAM superfamily enzyme YgiQ (UPF0313 family)
MSKVILYGPGKYEVPSLPLGLIAIGSELQKYGYEVKIVDRKTEKNAEDVILDALDSNTIAFCVTCLTGSFIEDALEVCKLVRKKNPKIPLVWGGFHASLLPEQTIKHPLVDIIVRGQGEETMVELADALKNKKSLEKIKGIIYKKNNKVFFNPERPLKDINALERLDYSLVDVEKYIRHDISPRTIDYISSRGCCYHCAFCSISTLYGSKWLSYNADRVVDEIEDIVKKYKIDGIHFMDDFFFADPKRVEKICDGIMKRSIKIKWWAMARCDIFIRLPDKLLEKLKKSGCNTLNFGAESGSQRILNMVNKGLKVNEILETAKRCKKYNFNAQFSFMCNFPFENETDLNLTLKLIDDIKEINNKFDVALFPFTPSPKTNLFEVSKKYGLKEPKSLEDWIKFDYRDISVPWNTKKQKKFFEALSYFCWLALSPSIEVKLKKWYFRFGYKIFHRTALFRWKYRKFGFPIEIELVKRFVSV